MKRILTSILALFFSALFLQVTASHVSGGSIKYKYLGTGSIVGSSRYYVEAAVYRDCSGVQYTASTAIITAKCSATSTSTNYTVNLLAFIAPVPTPYGGAYAGITFTSGTTSFSVEEISDVCDRILNPSKSPSTRCRSVGSIQGFTRFKYSGIITLSSCNFWTLGFSPQCCRNTASSNVASGAMWVETKFNSRAFNSNSSPHFGDERRPVFRACVGKSSEYHFGSNDPDKDSLTYKLVCAKLTATACVSYQSGFSATSPVAGSKLDTNTGRFQFKPAVVGKRVVAVLVSEYSRCTGAWIGSNLRDVTLFSTACNNKMPNFTYGIHKVTGGATKLDSFRLKVKSGKAFSIEDTIYDPDPNDSIVLFSNHNEFFRGSKITTTQVSKNRIHFKFSWTPPTYTTGVKVLQITISDDRCNYPGKKRIGYQLDFTPSLSIASNTPSVNDTLIIMKGDTARITSGGSGKIIWKSLFGDSLQWTGLNKNVWGDTVGTDTNSSMSFRPMKNTLLKVTGRVNQLCAGSMSADSIYINVIPPFQIKTSPETTVCSGIDSVQISVIPDSSFSYTYSWSSSNGKINNKKVANPYVTATKNGIYTVTVTSSFGGERVAGVRVNSIPDLPKHTLISSFDSMCVGGSIKLEAKSNSPVKFCSVGPIKSSQFEIDSYDSLNVLSKTTGSWIYPNPLSMKNTNSQQEYLYLAKALKKQGLKKGAFHSIAFYIDSTKSSSGLKILNGYYVKIGCTADSSTNNWKLNGLSGVVSNKTLSLKFGWNTIPFDTGYYWDGQSNLIIQLCYNHSSSTQTSVATAMQNITYNGALANYSSSSMCGSQMLNLTNRTLIPVIRFGFSPELDTSEIIYKWYPTTSFTSTVKNLAYASPRKTTTYSVSISDTFSVCRDSISKTVVIIPLQFTAGNDTAVCHGKSLTFMPVVKPNNNGSYTWFPASDFTNNKIKKPTLNVIKNKTISVFYKDSLGCQKTDTIVILSKANPDPGFTTKLKFCETEVPYTLTAATPGGVFIGPGISSTSFNAADPSNKPGLNSPKSVSLFHRVTVNGCVSDTTISVQVYPVFDTVYSGDRKFCETDSLEPLFTRHTGGFWSGNGVANSIFNPRITGKGLHTIRVDSTGFCGNSASYSFEVFESPNHDFPDTVYGCDNKPALLDAGNVGATYLWNTGAASQTITATKNGKYWVRIINGNLCEITDTTQVKITEVCIGIETSLKNSNQIKVFPNPTSRYLNIEIDRGEIKKVKLLSLSGQIVGMYAVNANKSMIDLLDISNGTYIIQVESDSNVESFVIIIEN